MKPIKRPRAFRDKYLAALLIAAASFVAFSAQGQGFPSTDSLHRYNNQWNRNSAVLWFTNLRGNTLIHGIIDWIDSARAGAGGSLGIDTVYAINDSTARYVKNGVTRTFVIKGVYDSRVKVEDVVALNDSMIRVTRNGVATNVLVRGASYTRVIDSATIVIGTDTLTVGGTGDVTQAYVDSLFATIIIDVPIHKGLTIKGTNTPADPLDVDTSANGQVATWTMVANAVGVGLTAVVHDGYGLTGDGTAGNPLKMDSSKYLTRSAGYTSIDSLALVIGGTAPDGSETKLAGLTGISISGTGTIADPYRILNTGLPGTNPFNAINAMDFGVIGDVTVPTSGSTFNGTNNKAMIDNAIAAAANNQWVVVPVDVLISTPLDSIKGGKTVNIIFMRNVYANGNDILRATNAGGPFEQHTIVFAGNLYGRNNMPSHSKSGATRSSPPWSSFTGTPVTLYNTHQVYVQYNKVEGFASAIKIIGDGNGVGAGSQENTIAFRWFYKNAIGVLQESADGSSYNDKNVFTGINGGTARVSGGLALKIDGYAPTVGDGPYNGAFRSNEYHFIVEQVDSIAIANGDISEPLFNITVEGGTNTGVFGTDPWQMRSTGANYVRSPKYIGQGILNANRLGTGSTGTMGLNGVIKTPIWATGSTAHYGDEAKIDGSGNIVIESFGSLSASARAAAPAYIKFVNKGDPRLPVTNAAATYTVATGVGTVTNTHGAATITLPSATTNVDRVIDFINDHASGALTISNVLPGDETSIPAGGRMSYKSISSVWRSLINPEGTGGGSGSKWTDAGVNIYRSSKVGIGVTSPTAMLHLPAGTTAANSAPLKINAGALNSSPENGAVESDGSDLYFTLESIRHKFMRIPATGGTAGQILQVTDDATELEYITPRFAIPYSLSVPFTITTIIETSLIGGAKTLPGTLAVGDAIECHGFGSVAGNTIVDYRFVIGSQTITLRPVNTIAAADKVFEYFFRYVPTTTGTSGTGTVMAWIKIAGDGQAHYAQANLNPINSVVPSFNVTIDYVSGAAFASTSLSSIIEVKRQ